MSAEEEEEEDGYHGAGGSEEGEFDGQPYHGSGDHVRPQTRRPRSQQPHLSLVAR